MLLASRVLSPKLFSAWKFVDGLAIVTWRSFSSRCFSAPRVSLRTTQLDAWSLRNTVRLSSRAEISLSISTNNSCGRRGCHSGKLRRKRLHVAGDDYRQHWYDRESAIERSRQRFIKLILRRFIVGRRKSVRASPEPAGFVSEPLERFEFVRRFLQQWFE